jgi:uncharacterized membrane protein YhaH (DUF805 family)
MLYYFAAIRRYFDFKGRSRRSEFFYFVCSNAIIIFILLLTELNVLFYAYYAFSLIPALSVSVRRMHDVGKSGWYYLIPIYNIILAFTSGEKGPNRFGEDPKG